MARKKEKGISRSLYVEETTSADEKILLYQCNSINKS